MKAVTISTCTARATIMFSELLGISEDGLFKMVKFVLVSAK